VAPFSAAWAVGHAAAFAVIVALVASQWQHRACTVSLHRPIDAEHGAGQAANKKYRFLSLRYDRNGIRNQPISLGGPRSTNGAGYNHFQEVSLIELETVMNGKEHYVERLRALTPATRSVFWAKRNYADKKQQL